MGGSRGLDCAFRHLLALAQVRTEQILEAHAGELGVPIRRGHTVTGLSQGDRAVHLEVAADGRTRTRTAPFVVGCDGAGSRVRRAAGIDFPGTGPNVISYVGDVLLDDPPPAGYSRHTPDGVFITAPLGGGRFRLAGYDPAFQDPAVRLTLDRLREITVRIAGTDFGMRDPVWLNTFDSATRVAATYRSGRVLLAGDAAHVHFPAGGVGMNVGLQDAMNLGWKLSAEVQGRAGPGLLDSYHDERHPVGLDLAEHTLAQTALLTATSDEGRALRSFLNARILDQPQLARALAEKLAGLDVAYPVNPIDPGGPAVTTTAHGLAGLRVPDLRLGPAGTVFELLRDGRPVLLWLAGEPPEPVRARARALGLRCAPGTLGAPAGPLAASWAGVGAAVVRPDGHVWWAADCPVEQSAALDGLAALPIRPA